MIRHILAAKSYASGRCKHLDMGKQNLTQRK